MHPPNLSKKILFLDGNPKQREAFQSAFGKDFSIRTCSLGSAAVEIMQKEGEKYPILIVDQEETDLTGIEVCKKVAAIRPLSIRMILTTLTNTRFFLDAINRGRVHDCILHPWVYEELKPVLEEAFQEYFEKLEDYRKTENEQKKTTPETGEVRKMRERSLVVGDGLKEVMEIVRKAALTDASVLILGETGVGKELLAYSIHQLSRRKDAPFIPVHCASLARGLMESELFGHKKGAFTGAEATRIGRFEAAHGGTLFLDEIGELSEEMQVKLLRVLQEKVIYRVGENQPIEVDVRLVAATHRNLEEMVEAGSFREDLFYRIHVIKVEVPPLRERKEDIPVLANEMIKKISQTSHRELSFSQEALEYLQRYDWPGNIRELQNAIERAAALTENLAITPEDLDLDIEKQPLQENQMDLDQLSEAPSIKSLVHREERKKLSELLLKARGNIAEASRISGIHRSTLFHRLRKYSLI